MKTIVALTGMPGSRKSMLAEKLRVHGYQHLMLSSYILQELRGAGRTDAPPEYWDASVRLRQEHGVDVLAQRASTDILAAKAERFVVDGLRCLPEAVTLERVADHFVLVAVQRSPRDRISRLNSSPHGFYQNAPDRIAQLDAHELRLGIAPLIALADMIIFLPTSTDFELDKVLNEHARAISGMAPQEDMDGEQSSNGRSHLQRVSALIST